MLMWACRSLVGVFVFKLTWLEFCGWLSCVRWVKVFVVSWSSRSRIVLAGGVSECMYMLVL